MRALVKISVLTLLAIIGALTLAEAEAQIVNIIPRTATWRYNTTCQDGTGWETTLFDDSAWAAGAGGFTGGETAAALVAQCSTTTLPAPNSSGRAGAAMYFRIHFNIASPAGLSLILSNAIDDAAVFYLNGTRILSKRVTANPALCATFGTGAIGPGTDALLWEVDTLTEAELSGVLVAGDNVLAVSVHQVNATSSDMIFAHVLMGATAAPPSINYAGSSLTNRAVRQCLSTTLSVSAGGSPAPTYQWVKDGSAITDATNATYTINNAQPGDAGNYRVTLTNPSGTTNSTPDTVVTVTADTTPPQARYALASTNGLTITVVFNEPIATNNVDFYGNLTLVDTNTGGQISLVGQTFPNSSTVILDVDPSTPLDLSHGYALTLVAVVDACAGNELPNTTIAVYTHQAIILPLAANWKYLDNDVDPAANWFQAAFDDSGWFSGNGPFDAKRNAGGAGTNCRPAGSFTNYFFNGTVIVPFTCSRLESPVSLTNLITTYFRTQFNYSGNTNATLLELSGKFDDGAVVYLNGTEVWRIGLPAAPAVITDGTFATRTVGDPEQRDRTLLITSTNLRTGNNLIAVELHQQSLTSSDLTMGLELAAITQTQLAQPPTLTITRNGGNVTVTWSGGGTLQQSTNLNSPANWSNIVGATSPYTTATTGTMRYFRVTQP